MKSKIEKMLAELQFEEKSHTYKYKGMVIPSVSTIMTPLNEDKYKGIDEHTLANAADKGIAVHNAIENWIKYGIVDIEPEHKGYFNAFLDWWRAYNPQVISSEIRTFHKLMRYGGTIDLLASIDGQVTLIDYKTTVVVSDMTCGVQLEGYAQALASHGIDVQRKMILHLTKDGKYKVIEYPAQDANRWRVFGSLKTVYDYIQSSK